MKLTVETIEILKNYATINQNMQFKQGSVLSTTSTQKNILTFAEISEDIPSTFAIYDLNRLLGAFSLFDKSPELDIGENKLTIVGDESKLNYVYANPKMLVLPPEKTLNFPDPEINFDMSKEAYGACMKAAQVLSLPELLVLGEEGKIFLVATDTNNS
ncbi:MAG: DNA polymerase, partial [Flavobacteriales bacterium]|nr:DNA polymerase [Flavobacteriales bacterium]